MDSKRYDEVTQELAVIDSTIEDAIVGTRRVIAAIKSPLKSGTGR
jgi:hypothetical protein